MRPVFMIVLITGLICMQCGQRGNKADIPDSESVYENITYLDSLLNSPKADSINLLSQQLENAIDAFRNNLQTPYEKAVFDSLERIRMASGEFILFCVDSHANLELLRQDIASVEEQYRSGKINAGRLVNALIESEQILVDINNRYISDSQRVLEALSSSRILTESLSTFSSAGLPMP
jgi:hypothetical protein